MRSLLQVICELFELFDAEDDTDDVDGDEFHHRCRHYSDSSVVEDVFWRGSVFGLMHGNCPKGSSLFK